ncbi:MAG TPA: hypothetical protein VHQ99_01535 [Gaiellaceae bacterium]|jgi:hypothetical protein|nr:hypothetical protein [Gaiellaceae bacterium]
MKKRIIAVLATSFAVLALAATAAAAITITQAPAGPGYQNLSPWTCEGHSYSLANGSIRLGFGWFANNQGGLKQFFTNTHGTVDISGTDTFHDQWARSSTGSPFVTQQGITWTSGEAGTGTTPSGSKVTGVSTAYRGVLALAPGSYTLTVAMLVDKTISDGWDSYPAGTGSLTGTCSFTVTP